MPPRVYATYSYWYEVDTSNGQVINDFGAATYEIEEVAPDVNGTLTSNSFVDVYFNGIRNDGGPFQYSSLFTVVDGSSYPLISDGLASNFVFTNTPLALNSFLILSAGDFTLCFGPNTLISCPSRSVRVADLSVGDEVLTPSGPRRVKFIGRSTRFLPDLRCTGRMPIEIQPGALGELGPTEPLLCSPSHAFLIDGLLVEAQALVNGTTIRQLDQYETFSFTYYSIELEEHGLIWANGLLAETYFASVRDGQFTRATWDNYADYVALYGEGGMMQELQLPRIPFARQLPAEIRELIANATAVAPASATAESRDYALV